MIDQEVFFTSPLLDFVTLADMSRELRVSLELIKKMVETNGLRPAKRNGVVRLWDRRDLDFLRGALSRRASSGVKQ